MEWFAAPDYWLSRLVFQRALAGLFVIAFVCAARQFRPLIGERGMTPVPDFVRRTRFEDAPSLFRLRYSDRLFAATAWTGAALSGALLAGLGDRVPLAVSMLLWTSVWVLYLSIVNVGQLWYGFGWESLLLEAGFLAIFLGNAGVAPPLPVLLLLRWLLFRVEFGAGLIKWRGDPCWRRLTCLDYHHETQPMPGPLSWFFHRLPRPLHRVEAAANHVTQLVVPGLLFAPQPVAGWAAAAVVVTQLWLVASGNFAWLNWLTLLLAFSAVDSSAWLTAPAHAAPPTWFVTVVLACAALMVVLAHRPVRNLLSSRQQMNRSYNPLHLSGSYGAFGSVTRLRHEIVVEGTDEREPSGSTRWREYDFPGKPGSVRRLPRQWAPYHLRLDWMLWFAAISPAYSRPWFGAFLRRLLENDAATLRLLAGNPFPDRPPEHVRALLYRYRFTTWRERRATGAWWHRELVGVYTPPVARRRVPEE
ncbi:lipase maturation factor family protein [Streptomyces sparsus]